MEWSIYNYLYYSKKNQIYLLYSSLSNMLIGLSRNDYEKIIKIKENPDIVNTYPKEYDILLKGRFVVESNECEKNKLILTALSQRYSSNHMSLTLAPTRACNFSCPYCYEDNRINNYMSEKTQQGIVDFVRRNRNLTSLSVVWYGGEPTLAINIIKYLSSELQPLVNNYNAFMVTNGFCLDKIVDSINELKITGLQITLDGTKETHDKTRHLINGNGTYDKILSNIDLLLSKCAINVSIRMNINTANSNQYALLHRILQNRYGQKVHLYPAFVHDYNGSCQVGTCFDDNLKKATFLKKLFYEKGIYTKDLYPVRISKGCMSQNMNSFVVGPDGELYKCWHHLGVKEKIVGNIFSEQCITNYSLLSDMMIKGDVLFDDTCKSCILFPSCTGGCADIKNKGEDYCIPAKAMLDEFLDVRYMAKCKMVNQ